MSKISKTAKASMVGGPTAEKKVIPDAELIRLLRIDRASGIWPSLQATDALLREYDKTLAVLAELNLHHSQVHSDLNDARQQIEKLMQLVPDTIAPENADAYVDTTDMLENAVAAVDGVPVSEEQLRQEAEIEALSVVQEPGLQPAIQGTDSIDPKKILTIDQVRALENLLPVDPSLLSLP